MQTDFDAHGALKEIRTGRQLEELTAAADALRRETGGLFESSEEISAIWKGDSADAYLQKLRLLSSELDRLQKEISDTIETARFAD